MRPGDRPLWWTATCRDCGHVEDVYASGIDVIGIVLDRVPGACCKGCGADPVRILFNPSSQEATP